VIVTLDQLGNHQSQDTHVLAVNVLWPDPLTDSQVAAHVVSDIVASSYPPSSLSHWQDGPYINEITDLAVPGLEALTETNHV
jgi:hypothetical protein